MLNIPRAYWQNKQHLQYSTHPLAVFHDGDGLSAQGVPPGPQEIHVNGHHVVAAHLCQGLLVRPGGEAGTCGVAIGLRVAIGVLGAVRLHVAAPVAQLTGCAVG